MQVSNQEYLKKCLELSELLQAEEKPKELAVLFQELQKPSDYAVMQFPFCIFTLQGFMSAVPRDYEESARIDGATNIQLLSRVMVPLAKPGIATITMLSAMGFWNEYPLALVLLTEDAKKTLPIGMANLFEVQKYATDWGALFAGLVIIMIPTIIIYLIGQRYLLQGIGAGGLKG